MSSLSLAPIYQSDWRLKKTPLADGVVCWRSNVNLYKVFLAGSFPGEMLRLRVGLNSGRRVSRFPCIRCEKKEEPIEQVSVELPPYDCYMDSTSGQLEPASGARASIPGEEYWPEGTSSQVRAANAPQPRGKSEGAPSYGKNPGSRRKKYKASDPSNESSQMTEDITVSSEAGEDSTERAYSIEEEDDGFDKSKELFSDYVVYQTEPEEQEVTEFELDKEMGRPHPFIDPKVRKPIEQSLSSEEAWWYWGKPDKEEEERCEWQRRKTDAETVFLKAMAETGQVKLFGDHPTLTETSLYRARRHLYKEERLQDETKRLETIGPLAYYSEWVQAWKRDTSREAVQKHFEETGEDENTQLIQMFQHQTDRENRIMMGTDVRIRRDPLAMRMREDQIKQIWGGDPVFPTVNSIQDPNEVIDFRSPDYHEPTPNFVSILKERGSIITNEELQKILSKEKTEVVEVTDMDEAMARAVDIGENDDGDDSEDSEVDGDDDKEEKISQNWSVLKSAPELYKSKDKAKKQGPLSLEEAIDDSENLTDFLLDFNEDE